MTVAELGKLLASIGVNPRRYDLSGSEPAASEGIVIGLEGGKWSVRHFERGSWYTLGTFNDESVACEEALRRLRDPFYRR